MAKGKRRSTPPLTDYWSPPSHLDEGVGEPRVCLATTFEFEATFFEIELLPRFLGLRFDHIEAELAFLVEREAALESVQATVLVDIGKFDPGQTTLRWDQCPVHIPGGIQHSKVCLLVWERCIRVLVGSANLTRSGYRRNRELFAALDFWDGKESVPRSLLGEVLDWLRSLVSATRCSPEVIDRFRKGIETSRSLMRSWSHMPAKFGPNESPRVSFVATAPKLAGSTMKQRSTLDEVIELWGTKRASGITVITPFAGKCGTKNDPVISRLTTVPRTRDCESWLVTPLNPSAEGDPKVSVPLPDNFCRQWYTAFSDQAREAFILPIPLSIEGVDEHVRDLHAKALLIEADSSAILCIGSSNFTPHGMGVAAHNIEANLAFMEGAGQASDGCGLADRLGLPLAMNKANAADPSLLHGEGAVPPEDDSGQQSRLPPFFAWANYSQVKGQLQVGLDRSQVEPSEWSIRLAESAGSDSPELFRSPLPAEAPESVLTYTLPEPIRAANLVALCLTWMSQAGEPMTGYMAVSAPSADDLLPPQAFRTLKPESIIDCLISGKSPANWLVTARRGSRSDDHKNRLLDSLRAVDTSGYLLYRVRKFGKALAGLGERLMRTAALPAALRYRLLRDPFGPVSLARSLEEVHEKPIDDAFASMDPELRAFLAGELLLCLHSDLQRYRGQRREELKRLSRRAKAELEECFSTALSTVNCSVQVILRQSPSSVAANLRDYLGRISEHTGSPLCGEKVEDHDAGRMDLRVEGDQSSGNGTQLDFDRRRGEADDDRPGDTSGVER